MSVTLEQCSILASEYHLAEHEMKKALSIMRRYVILVKYGARQFCWSIDQVIRLSENLNILKEKVTDL